MTAQPSAAQRAAGAIAPEPADLTDEVLFGGRASHDGIEAW
ncbi:hypothetical protein [Nocardiopsis sp. CNT-189]